MNSPVDASYKNLLQLLMEHKRYYTEIGIWWWLLRVNVNLTCQGYMGVGSIEEAKI